MDGPRRWQVASLAVAVAGLGLGSLMLGRSPSVEIAPIDLDAAAVSSPSDDPALRLPVPHAPEIVPPRVREDQLSPQDGAASFAGSPDEPAIPRSRERSAELREPTPSGPVDDDPADDDDRDEPDDDPADEVDRDEPDDGPADDDEPADDDDDDRDEPADDDEPVASDDSAEEADD